LWRVWHDDRVVSSSLLLGAGLDLVNVGLSRALIGGNEQGVDLLVFGKPGCHLVQLFAQASDALMIHVGLCNELRHGD
jgi:hypothetical protein